MPVDAEHASDLKKNQTGIKIPQKNKKRKELAELESRYGVEIVLEGDPSIALGNGKLEFLKENDS